MDATPGQARRFRPIWLKPPEGARSTLAAVLRSRSLLTAAAVAAACVAATSAGAARSVVYLTVTPDVVHRGHTVVIRGSAGSCPVGDVVTIMSRAFPAIHEFAGVPAVLAKVTSGGHFRVRTRIPLHRHSGLYHVTARCGGGNLGVYSHVRVLR